MKLSAMKLGQTLTVAEPPKQTTPAHRTKFGKAEKGSLKEYKASRGGDSNTAINYAYALAAKMGKPMLVLPGNSFGHRVFIIKEAKSHVDAIRTVNVTVPSGFPYAQVDPDGTIWELTW